MDSALDNLSGARPFVKWVGGKRSIISTLQANMPRYYRTYNEPFLGGGALFFSTRPAVAHLSDINARLITSYKAIRDDIDAVIASLEMHTQCHTKEHFLKARTRLSSEANPAELAGLFIYLNKTCYNGLYRVNKGGGFNVPMGSYAKPMILDEENLRRVSQSLQTAQIAHTSFRDIIPMQGDFYYLDPPYHKAYASYAEDGFSDEMHEELAILCCRIDATGGLFMLSNSDTEFIRDLYRGFNIKTVMAGRAVSCRADQRGRTRELIIRNYE